jgi:hypothetical protein
MYGVCSSQPLITTDAILAILGSVGLIVAALTALAVRVLKNAKDIGAAWEELRAHREAISVAVVPAEKGQER